ncbi:MAG: hypothetical protein ABIQ04_00275 [Candidatus Saccharimonadales bacterium]
MKSTTQPSEAFLEVQAQRKVISNQLFELTVKDNWFKALDSSLRSYTGGSTVTHDRYYAKPELKGLYGRLYLGGSELTQTAREYKEDALGEKINDDRLKELIEEVLHDELEKYGIELKWYRRRNWDGTDRVLLMYSKSENVPSDT